MGQQRAIFRITSEHWRIDLPIGGWWRRIASFLANQTELNSVRLRQPVVAEPVQTELKPPGRQVIADRRSRVVPPVVESPAWLAVVNF